MVYLCPMSCPTCTEKKPCNWASTHICMVCFLLDDDNSEKPTCYCKGCGEHICAACWDDGIRRAKAMIIHADYNIVTIAGKLFKYMKSNIFAEKKP